MKMTDKVDLNTKIAMLRKQGAFMRLTDSEIEALAGLLTEKRVPAGEQIVTEGDTVDSVYLVVSGTADVRHVTVQNNALHIESLATLGPDAAIGLSDTGFYSLSGIRTATVVAKTDMVLLHLSVPRFHGFALDNAHVHEVMQKNFEHLE